MYPIVLRLIRIVRQLRSYNNVVGVKFNPEGFILAASTMASGGRGAGSADMDDLSAAVAYLGSDDDPDNIDMEAALEVRFLAQHI